MLLPSFLHLGQVTSTFQYPDQASATSLALSRSVGVLAIVAGITVLRWWSPVLHESLRTRHWVWIIPIAFLVVSVAKIDYSRLANAGAALTATLVLGALAVAASEELVFRGVLLTFLRDRYSETVAAIATAVTFGFAHALNGPVAIVMTGIFGYLLYLTRRVSGGILLPILVHAAWDFSVFSAFTTATPSSDSSTGATLALTSLVLIVTALVSHKFIAPRPVPAP